MDGWKKLTEDQRNALHALIVATNQRNNLGQRGGKIPETTETLSTAVSVENAETRCRELSVPDSMIWDIKLGV